MADAVIWFIAFLSDLYEVAPGMVSQLFNGVVFKPGIQRRSTYAQRV